MSLTGSVEGTKQGTDAGAQDTATGQELPQRKVGDLLEHLEGGRRAETATVRLPVSCFGFRPAQEVCVDHRT